MYTWDVFSNFFCTDLNKEDFFQTSNAEKDKFEEEYGEMKTYRVRYPGADNLNQKVKMVQ